GGASQPLARRTSLCLFGPTSRSISEFNRRCATYPQLPVLPENFRLALPSSVTARPVAASRCLRCTPCPEIFAVLPARTLAPRGTTPPPFAKLPGSWRFRVRCLGILSNLLVRVDQAAHLGHS